MIATYIAGGAAINALGAMVGADLTVIDVGVAGVPPARCHAAARRRPSSVRRSGPARTT